MGVFLAVLCLVLYLWLLVSLLRPYLGLVAEARARGRGGIQFTILDCWAIIIGLLPTCLYVGKAVSHWETAGVWTLVPFVYLAASQLSGIFMVMATELPPGHEERSNVAAALGLVIGALVGLLLPIVGPVILVLEQQSDKKK